MMMDVVMEILHQILSLLLTVAMSTAVLLDPPQEMCKPDKIYITMKINNKNVLQTHLIYHNYICVPL